MSKTAEKQALTFDSIPHFLNPTLDDPKSEDDEIYTGSEHDKVWNVDEIKRRKAEIMTGQRKLRPVEEIVGDLDLA